MVLGNLLQVAMLEQGAVGQDACRGPFQAKPFCEIITTYLLDPGIPPPPHFLT